MPFHKLQSTFRLLAALLLVSVSTAVAAELPGKGPGPSKRYEREKAFLLRSSDELNTTLMFANETLDLLSTHVGSAANRKSDDKTNERVVLLDWYQKYVDRLEGISSELDQDVSSYYAQEESVDWPAFYEELGNGCRDLASELNGTVRKLEGEKKQIETRMQKLNTAVLERRILVDKDDLELARELWPTYRVPYNRYEAVYKDLTDEEVLYFQNELRSLGEQQKYFECLTELGRYEQVWLDIKAGDFTKLSEIARAVTGDDQSATVYAFKSAIRTYESDIKALKRVSSELAVKIHGITRSGSLKTLDRLEELSRYYENMRSRYERQIEWLRGQIGSYQADLIEIRKEF